MEMGKKGTVTANGISYRYVLSVMDVFSRFVWLRDLSDKCSKAIASELKSIYGPPLESREIKGENLRALLKNCVEI